MDWFKYRTECRLAKQGGYFVDLSFCRGRQEIFLNDWKSFANRPRSNLRSEQ